MAEDRPISVCQNGREPQAMLAHSRVPKRVDAPMQRMQSPCLQPAGNRSSSNAKSEQLPPAQNPELTTGCGRQRLLSVCPCGPPGILPRVTFCIHMVFKLTNPRSLPVQVS